ncbi:hypothetical protein [Piscinibacter sp.]|jgi:hypothetical protein|uniref:hypothetical protein n=1 Tax=Piscinibacter sp. TaxID=1903157 RepID=UPI002F416C12
MNTDPERPATSQRQLIEAITAVLAQHDLPPGSASVSVRSYGGSAGDVPALLVFVRLNVWKPDVLLGSKIIEKRVRDTLYKAMKVRIGYVFWRIGSDVETPYDHTERFHVRAAAPRLEALSREAEAAGATPPADAPLTDWSDMDDGPVR